MYPAMEANTEQWMMAPMSPINDHEYHSTNPDVRAYNARQLTLGLGSNHTTTGDSPRGVFGISVLRQAMRLQSLVPSVERGERHRQREQAFTVKMSYVALGGLIYCARLLLDVELLLIFGVVSFLC
ncbi:hypothetical protein BS78_10G101300 [Paspalum vaginatum]|nr:hypothetical protein BS78_10G101300 [Paspalum vaginatum]